MTNTSKNSLPDAMFLIDVKDSESGLVMPALSLERSPAMLLSYAANHFSEAASKYFKDHFDLGAVDWRLLFAFAREPGATAAHASKTMGVDKGAVSRSLQRLEAGGLVVAGELHANGRSRGWRLTKKGHQLHQRILKVALARQKEMLTGFEPEEVKVFCNCLGKFLQNLHRVSSARE